jgi:transcriptional enhancer factor
MNPHIIKLSPRLYADPKIKSSACSNLAYLSGFPSPCELVLQSTFLVYLDDSQTPLHSEIAPLKCLSSPMQESGGLYSSEIAPDFWETLCSSPGELILSYPLIFGQCDCIDLTRYTILQSLKQIPAVHFDSNAGTGSHRATPTIFIVYKFGCQEPAMQTHFNAVAQSAYSASYPVSTSHNQVRHPPQTIC